MVIGAANIDMIALSKGKLRMGDSNIGSVEFSFGGVGRNIAENLARLGNQVALLSAFGTDAFGEMLHKDLQGLGIDLSASLFSDKQSGFYLAVADADGDLLVAVCENEIVKEIDPEHLEKNLDYINSFEHLFFDANLSREALAFLFENVRGQIYIDATSVEKSKQIKPYLDRIALLKGNRAEICALSGCEGSVKAEIEALVRAGVKRVVATDGPKAVYFNDGKESNNMPVPPARVLSTNGAGDAFMSGVIHGLLSGKSFEEGLRYGINAARATLMVRGACNPDLHKYI